MFFCIRICNCICIFICWLDLCVTKQKNQQTEPRVQNSRVALPRFGSKKKRKQEKKVRIEKQTEMSHVRDLFLMGYCAASPSLYPSLSFSFCCFPLPASFILGLFAVWPNSELMKRPRDSERCLAAIWIRVSLWIVCAVYVNDIVKSAGSFSLNVVHNRTTHTHTHIMLGVFFLWLCGILMRRFFCCLSWDFVATTSFILWSFICTL